MIIVNTSPNKLIQIGYEGEDKVTILRFSYSEKWLENGEGIFTVRVLRNGENKAYNAQAIKDDRENFTIDMTVTDIELSKKGYGEMQLVYTGADFVKKSPVYKYYVSRSVDEAVDPPESDVYTQIIESLSDLRTNFNELTNTVNEINDDIGDLTELTTANKLNIVESINEVNAKGFVSVDDELSDTSTNPVQNKAIASRITSVESVMQGKADIQTVTTLSDTVADLQTKLAEKVGDVQVNGTSIVTGGVANVPVASNSVLGTVRIDTSKGLGINDAGIVSVAQASSNNIKSGTRENNPVTPIRQHEATFYGLAKVAGHDEKDSTLPVGEYTSEAKTAIQTMLDVPSTATVSALADEVNGLDEDVQGLQTTVQSKADTATVTALSGTVSGLQTAVQSKADAQTVTALSGTVSALSDAAQQYMEHTEAALDNKVEVSAFSDLSGTVTGLQTSKADKSYVDTQLAGKASTQTVSDLADDVSDLQTGLAEKVSDVQVNGSSVVTNGVANVPVANRSALGLVQWDYGRGVAASSNGMLILTTATSAHIKGGTRESDPITPVHQHESTFYGLAKIAGHDEKNSTLPVGTYSEEAKIAIQKMLGIYEAPWELINEETFTNETEADYIITTDLNGNAFELTDAILLFETPTQETEAKCSCVVRYYFYGVNNYIATESYSYTQSSNATATGFVSAFEQKQKMLHTWSIARATTSNNGGYMSRYGVNFGMPLGRSGDRISYALLDEPIYCHQISILNVTGTGHYRLYGKRKWQ